MKQEWPKAQGLDKLKADSSKLKARIEARDQGEKKVKARRRLKLIAKGDQIPLGKGREDSYPDLERQLGIDEMNF